MELDLCYMGKNEIFNMMSLGKNSQKNFEYRLEMVLFTLILYKFKFHS